MLKKRLYPRTQQVDFSSNDGDGSDDEDNMWDVSDTELPRKKKAKKNSPEAEAVSSSSSDNSCFVALITASNLRTDTLVFPFLPHLPELLANSFCIL